MTAGVDWGDHEAISIMDNRISPFGRPGYKQPPTLDALCAALRSKGGQYDHELRADSIYGPLRLKTEPALIGIRKRRVQHQENARLYVFRSFRQAVEQLSDRDGLKPLDKRMLRAYLEEAWVDERFSGAVTPSISQRMVLCLRDNVRERLSRYSEWVEKKNNRAPGAGSSPKPSGLQTKQEIAAGLAVRLEKIEKNARSRGSLELPRIDQKHAQPSEREVERASPLHSSQASSAGLFVDWVNQRGRDLAYEVLSLSLHRDPTDHPRDAGLLTSELTGKQRLEKMEDEPPSPVTMHFAPRSNASQSLPAAPSNPVAGDSHHAGTKPLRFKDHHG